MPILPKIKGIPLPKFQEAFFGEKSKEQLNNPEASKLNADVFKNRPQDNPLQESPLEKNDTLEQKDKVKTKDY